MSTYKGAHRTLAHAYGPAASYPCAAPRCERQAHDWALIGSPTVTAPHGGRLATWSTIADAYRPLCRSHHLMLDRGGDWEHCPNGHPRTVGVAGSWCRACDRDSTRERMRRRRAARQTTRTSGSTGHSATTERNPI